MIIQERTNEPVFIGYIGENESREIPFFIGDIKKKYPDATYTVMHQRPTDAAAYPVSSDYYEISGNALVWTVQSGDLTAEGYGKFQIKAAKNGKIRKTKTWVTQIGEALEATTDPPDPWSGWTEEIAEQAAALVSMNFIDDTAGEGNTDKTWSADKLTDELALKAPKASPTFTGTITGSETKTKLGKNLTDMGPNSTVVGIGNYNYGDVSAGGAFAEWTANTQYRYGDLVKISDPLSSYLGYWFCKTANSDASFTSSKWISITYDYRQHAFVVGNGADTSNITGSNALTVDWNGDVRAMGDVYTGASEDGTGGSKLAKVSELPTVHNVPSGGTTGQVLAKNSGTDYDLKWVNQSGGGSVTLNYVTPEDYGAEGDGTTDDSEAVQDAIDAGYAVYFASNKTYYLASTVTVDHDCYLYGGENTVIKTVKLSGGSAYDGIVISGTLKKTTTLTSNYESNGTTDDNCNNRFTLSDMTDIDVGDIMVIEATDQYYHYARDYYHLGATLLITDVYDGHIYTCDIMPYDITNTENVSVKIYSAPQVTVDNLKFESSGYDGGNYKYLMRMSYCKNSSVKNCEFSEMDNGIRVGNCVNAELSDIALSKCKYDNSLSGDGYGIAIYSCSNTIVKRVLATCAQHAITITGQLPSINTYIYNCNLTSECRSPGLDTHESTYNLIIEDCVLGTAALNGTVHINRCRIINNRRFSNQAMNISVYGSHNPDWSSIVIENTKFEGTAGISVEQSGVQSPVEAFDNVYGEIRIENCTGGKMQIIPAINSTILSNTIKSLTIRKWENCQEIYVSGTWKAQNGVIANSTFAEQNFINDHTPSHGVVTSNFEELDLSGIYPMIHKHSINRDTFGECVTLPENVVITFSSDNSSAKYMVCGANLVSDNIDDYCVGSVSGSAGGTLTRTPSTSSSKPVISFNASGNLVYAQGSTTYQMCVYPYYAFYVKESSDVEVSANLVNSGDTTGASFKAFMAVVDCSTGKLIDRFNSSAVQATAQGAECSRSRKVDANCIVLCYFYCESPVSGAETTIEDWTVKCDSAFGSKVNSDAFTANRRTGDGTLTSFAGINNIMSSDLNFHVSFKADYVSNPVGLLPSGTGVSF